jgi:hypothetical protein
MGSDLFCGKNGKLAGKVAWKRVEKPNFGNLWFFFGKSWRDQLQMIGSLTNHALLIDR